MATCKKVQNAMLYQKSLECSDKENMTDALVANKCTKKMMIGYGERVRVGKKVE